MQITYNLTEEFKEKYISTNFDTKTKAILRIIILVSSIVLLIISLMAIIAKDLILFMFPMIISIIGFYVAFLPKILKKKYFKSLDFDDNKVVQIDKDGLFFKSSSRTTHFNYSEIKSIRLIDNYFILIVFRPGDSIAIPKYAFSNDNEMIDFINKIKSNAKIL